jgi:hypothetical protein
MSSRTNLFLSVIPVKTGIHDDSNSSDWIQPEFMLANAGTGMTNAGALILNTI